MSDNSNGLVIQPITEELNLKSRQKKHEAGSRWKDVIQRVTNMTASEAAAYYGEVANNLAVYGEVALRDLMVLRAIQSFIEDPSPALWNLLMEREEGRVADTVNVNQIGAVHISITRRKDDDVIVVEPNDAP